MFDLYTNELPLQPKGGGYSDSGGSESLFVLHPTTVLVSSVCFIGLVVILHIFGHITKEM